MLRLKKIELVAAILRFNLRMLLASCIALEL